MRTFADKSQARQQTASAKSTIPSRAHFGHSPEGSSTLHLQRTIGNQAVQRTLLTHAEDPIARLTDTASPRFRHDFSRIPIHASARGQKPPEPEAPKPDAKPEPAAPKPEPKPEPKPVEAKKPTKPTIAHETTLSAPDGTDKKRTDVGVGEEVTFTGSAVGKWTATSGTPKELASGDKLVWTAPDRAATVTIKLQVGAEQETVSMKVIEPDNITGRKNSEIPIGAGTAGAGMKLTFIYHPKNVSFGNVQAKEVSGPATNITGYYKKHYTADGLKHDSGDTFTPIKETNEDSAEDTASTEDKFKPYEKGTFDWVIPNKFKVKTEAGDGKKFTDVTQACSMLDATGKIRITKATTAKVERSPSDP